MKIRCDYDPKPVPDRNFDWTAIDANIYDGATDAGHQCVGYGHTKAEALAMLREELLERAIENDEDLYFHAQWEQQMRELNYEHNKT